MAQQRNSQQDLRRLSRSSSTNSTNLTRPSTQPPTTIKQQQQQQPPTTMLMFNNLPSSLGLLKKNESFIFCLISDEFRSSKSFESEWINTNDKSIEIDFFQSFEKKNNV